MVLVPSPIWPTSLRPQHQSVSLLRMPQVWPPSLAATAFHVVLVPMTTTGATWATVPPLPIAPKSLLPQHQRVVSVRIPHVWVPPALSTFHVVAPTCAGEICWVVVPMPAWLWVLTP